MIADSLRNANSEHEVYSLLTSYIETVRYANQSSGRIVELMTRLPLNGISDVKTRFSELFVELDKASKAWDDISCAAIKEGMYALGAALNRLNVLNEQQNRQSH